MRVGVVGLGYVGSALATAAQDAGHEVLGVDIDPTKIREVPGITASTDYAMLANCDVVVIAVPTPLNEERKPDLRYLNDVTARLRQVLTAPTLVINESTSYPGTLRNLIAPRVGVIHMYASAPERVDPGSSTWSLRNTPRVVAGLDEVATKAAVDFYRTICDDVVVVSSPEVAESAKLFENTFRQVNIALVNEFARIADSLSISTFDVLDAAATKPFGFMKFLPSVGVGGHCIPVDPSYLSYVAEENGLEAKFIDLANRINLEMPAYVATRIERELGDLSGKVIQVVGISYKANVPDTRETPALGLIKELRRMGAKVSWHDPVVKEWNGEVSTPISTVDAGVIVTAHDGIDFGPWRASQTRVFDVSTATHLEWPKFL